MMLTGPASVPPTSVCEVFKKVVKKYPNKPALRVKRNGEWKTWTFKQYYLDVARGAKSLIKLGVEPHSGICVIGFNSPEWFISYVCGIMVGQNGCTVKVLLEFTFWREGDGWKTNFIAG